MKITKFLAIASLASVLLVCCQEEDNPQQEGGNTEVLTGVLASIDGWTTWKDGDHITLWHDGKTYDMVAETGEDTAVFCAADEQFALLEINPDKPVAAYYNVSGVAADGTATFSIQAEQTEGTASNEISLYAYVSKPEVDGGTLALVFKPLCSVLELELQATSRGEFTREGKLIQASEAEDLDYFISQVVFTPKDGMAGYTSVKSATIDPATGEVSTSDPSPGSLTYNFAELTNIRTPRTIRLVVGDFSMWNVGATLDWYKGDILNYSTTIWDNDEIDFASGKKKFSQTVEPKYFGFGDYTSYYSIFWGLRNHQEQYLNYCDDECNLLLTTDLQMQNKTGNRIRPYDANLKWNLDGRGHCLYDVNVIPEGQNPDNYYFIKAVSATVKNIVFGRQGDANNSITVSGSIEMAAPILQLNEGGVVENCTNWCSFSVNHTATDKHTYLGGIVARAKGGCIRNCTNNGDLTLTWGGTSASVKNVRAGGISADNETKAVSIENCTNNGAVTVSGDIASGYHNFGGIIGNTKVEGCAITGCTNNGAVTYTSTNTGDVGNLIQCFGGIIGLAENGITVSGCTNSGEVTATLAGTSGNSCGGGIMGKVNNGANTVTGCTVRAGITVKQNGGDGRARWHVCQIYGTPTLTQEKASVLKGITVNGTAITETNYWSIDYATRGSGESGLAKTQITLLTE